MNVKRRAFAAVITVLFAAAAAAGVFLFMQNVREDATGVIDTVDVVVATVEIPAGEELDPLIEQGVFAMEAVSRDSLVQGVITDTYQLAGQRTAYPILAGEQISAARLAGPLQAAGGTLGIPAGHQAASLTLEPQRVVAGLIRGGDHVEVFATFTGQVRGDETTRVVIPDALVLWTQSGAQAGSGSRTITLAVTPVDASLLIFAQEQGHLWLTLLPPNEAGVVVPPVTSRVLR